LKRIIAAIFAALLLVVGLTACSSQAGVVADTQVNLGQIGEINTINTDVAGAPGGEKNAAELANLTTAKFYQQDSNGRLVANELLGRVEVVTTSPLKVKYTLADGATWSDGTPIDAADLALSLAAGSGVAGVNFYSIRSGTGLAYASLAEKPAVGDNSITVAYSRPVADYLTAITLPVAAHTVGNLVDKSLDANAAKQMALEAITGTDVAKLKVLAESYRSAFSTWSGLHDEKLFVSSGAYRVQKSTGKSALELVANAGFKLGPAPVIEKIALSYFVDSASSIAALSDGKIDATNTADSGLVTLADILGLVGQIKGQNVTPAVRAGSSAEQIVFNFQPQSRFSTERNGGDAAKALTLRKAFMNLIPRSRIVSGLSTAYKVSLSDSLVFQSGNGYYKASVQDNGLSEFLFQDLEKASELFDSTATARPMKVRVAYDQNNPRSQAEWILLRERAASAGFNLKAVDAADFQAALDSGNFEIYLGARPMVSIPGQNVFSLTSDSFVGYSNEKVQKALTNYAAASDEQSRGAALKEIDALLVADAYGMPLYEVPSMVVYNDRVVGFAVAPWAESVTWGYQNWSINPKS
jgi:peptide/nickel transport system substrate-binding protein